MEDAQDQSNQDTELAGEVAESLGEPKEEMEETASSDGQETQDPLYVQKRLKQQKRAHEREMREMHARLEHLQSQVNSKQPPEQRQDDYEAPQGELGEQITKAVSFALGSREREERRAKEAESQAHVQKQYHELHKHLDKVSDKYDDFDDVVRGPDAPFTTHMRDAALFLDLDHNNPGSAGEVLYKLAKDPETLSKIAKLHPLDQAREMVKLSKALISGGEPKGTSPRPLGQIKNTPVTDSRVVNEKTPVSSIRQRMKSGNWK